MHGPQRSGEYVDGVMEAARSMNATTAPITFCGHVHTPSLYHMNQSGKVGEFTPVPDVNVPLSKLRRWLVQPGSVGQPRDGNPPLVTRSLIRFNKS